MTTQTLQFSTPDDTDELARAELYGLLAHLYHAPPEASLYAQLRDADTTTPVPGAFLEASWGELVAAARRLPPETVRDEFEALFVAIGKPEIFLFGSFYIAGALNEKPLAALRHDLQVLGLERPPTIHDTEDHLASLCEVMRFLIAGDDLAVSNLAAQKRFFDTHLRPWTDTLCALLAQHPRADFYRALALFTRDFMAVESQAFDLIEAQT